MGAESDQCIDEYSDLPQHGNNRASTSTQNMGVRYPESDQVFHSLVDMMNHLTYFLTTSYNMRKQCSLSTGKYDDQFAGRRWILRVCETHTHAIRYSEIIQCSYILS